MCKALTQLRRWRPEPCCVPASTFLSLRPSKFHVTKNCPCHVCSCCKFADVSFATTVFVKDGDLFQCFCLDLLTTKAQPTRCVWKAARAASQGPSGPLPPFMAVNIIVTKFKHAVTGDVCSCRSVQVICFRRVSVRTCVFIYVFCCYTPGWLSLSDRWQAEYLVVFHALPCRCLPRTLLCQTSTCFQSDSMWTVGLGVGTTCYS